MLPIAEEHMLALVRGQQDDRTTWQSRQIERRCRRECRKPLRNDRQHMDAPARTPEHGRIASVRLGETEHPSAKVAGQRDHVEKGSRDRALACWRAARKSCWNAGLRRKNSQAQPRSVRGAAFRMIFHPAHSLISASHKNCRAWLCSPAPRPSKVIRRGEAPAPKAPGCECHRFIRSYAIGTVEDRRRTKPAIRPSKPHRNWEGGLSGSEESIS